MIRVVCDTNLLVSYLLTHRPPIATLLDSHLASGDLVLVSAPALMQELDRVLSYSKLQRYYTPAKRKRFIALLLALAEVVDLPEEIPPICRDPDDDLAIACAIAGRADVIVSGDGDLLDLEAIGEISILPAAQVLEALEGDTPLP